MITRRGFLKKATLLCGGIAAGFKPLTNVSNVNPVSEIGLAVQLRSLPRLDSLGTPAKAVRTRTVELQGQMMSEGWKEATDAMFAKAVLESVDPLELGEDKYTQLANELMALV